MKRTSPLSFALILLAILSASCTKEVKYSKEALYDKAKAADASVTFILPKGITEGVNCSDYTSGCVSAHTVRVQNIDMIAVEFMTEQDAIYAAKKFRGYYYYNWMFDDVSGEPALEKFVTEKLEAKKP